MDRLVNAGLLALLVSLVPARMTAAPTAEAGAGAGMFRGPEPGVLELALSAARCAQGRVPLGNASLLTVIDYSRASTTPRLWVVEIDTGRVLFEELVAHGRGSGENLPSRFSNEPGSLASSLGLFVTRDTYVGSNGYSLRLQGLEAGVNDRAYERAIVMHGAAYVREGMDALGRLGRSWGCPALRPAVARQLIDTIKGGSLVFAYYPDAQWLQESAFVGRCGIPSPAPARALEAGETGASASYGQPT